MKNKPNYYAILPADVRYCKALKPIERLIFAEITCLCNHKGYCWANNYYFAELFQISIRSASRYINHLKELDFIKVSVVRDAYNKVEKRTIKIENYPIDKTVYASRQNCPPPIDKTVQYNIKKENIKKEKLFEQFWENYDKKKSRKPCLDKFLKLTLEQCEACVTAAKKYAESTSDFQFRKYPLTWLNQECWNDEVFSKDNSKISGGKLDGMVL